SVEFKRAAPFAGQRVLIVGGGNSAADIAFEVSRVAARTCISMRRGYHIFPKMLLGEPVDVLYSWVRLLPRALVALVLRIAFRLTVGRLSDYGLQMPQPAPLRTHPTINTNLLLALKTREIVAKVDIARLDGERIVFCDGTAEPFDTIIWATGY